MSRNERAWLAMSMFIATAGLVAWVHIDWFTHPEWTGMQVLLSDWPLIAVAISCAMLSVVISEDV